jgi:hypothetical protein
MTIVECDVPVASALDRQVVEAAYFSDAYRASLSRKHASVVDLFFAVLGHHPMWLKLILVVRNRIASVCGLDVPTVSEIMHPEVKSSYRVGDKIGPWPIFSLTETELVAGRDNKHLDFRLSMLKEMNDKDESATAVISTICTTHNIFGKIYLFFIIPFHKWGVRRLMANAVLSGRL